MTNFEKFKEEITPEDLARMTVKLCLLNDSEHYYVTSTGQLYPMNGQGLKQAIEHEIAFWNTLIPETNIKD